MPDFVWIVNLIDEVFKVLNEPFTWVGTPWRFSIVGSTPEPQNIPII